MIANFLVLLSDSHEKIAATVKDIEEKLAAPSGDEFLARIMELSKRLSDEGGGCSPMFHIVEHILVRPDLSMAMNNLVWLRAWRIAHGRESFEVIDGMTYHRFKFSSLMMDRNWKDSMKKAHNKLERMGFICIKKKSDHWLICIDPDRLFTEKVIAVLNS